MFFHSRFCTVCARSIDNPALSFCNRCCSILGEWVGANLISDGRARTAEGYAFLLRYLTPEAIDVFYPGIPDSLKSEGRATYTKDKVAWGGLLGELPVKTAAPNAKVVDALKADAPMDNKYILCISRTKLGATKDKGPVVQGATANIRDMLFG